MSLIKWPLHMLIVAPSLSSFQLVLPGAVGRTVRRVSGWREEKLAEPSGGESSSLMSRLPLFISTCAPFRLVHLCF